MTKRNYAIHDQNKNNPWESGFMVDDQMYYLEGMVCGICKGDVSRPHKPSFFSLVKHAVRIPATEQDEIPVFGCDNYHVFHRYCMDRNCKDEQSVHHRIYRKLVGKKCKCPSCKIPMKVVESRNDASPLSVEYTDPLFMKTVELYSRQNKWKRQSTVSWSRRTRYPSRSNTRSKSKSKSKTMDTGKNPLLDEHVSYYEIMGVEPSAVYADDKQIKKKYHILALKYHTDKCGSRFQDITIEQCKSIIQKLNQAKDVLTDPQLSSAYFNERHNDATMQRISAFQDKLAAWELAHRNGDKPQTVKPETSHTVMHVPRPPRTAKTARVVRPGRTYTVRGGTRRRSHS